MAKITLSQIRHSYMPNPKGPEDYALQQMDVDWQDGGAYALLGPSGCGKTTLLNLISGLLTPSHGKILFDDQDVTQLPPDQRNIAQVFQFPVIYDTMNVYDNLAFPLRNRGVDKATIDQRVHEVAEMLEVSNMLKRKAAGLSPDNKQKLSMGRGLVRDDVNVVMFDEPLTVIDPHLKWKLRSKLKELHQKVRHTMIYVTHDQTEALTFADEVVVMDMGQVVQIGTPVELFERPAHTFVGHFIGSPGMNVIPCEVVDGRAMVDGNVIELEGNVKAKIHPVPPFAKEGTLQQNQVVAGEPPPLQKGERGGFSFSEGRVTTTSRKQGKTEIGVRPEFVSINDTGIEATVRRVSDVGRHAVVEAMIGEHRVAAIHHGETPNQGDKVRLAFKPEQTRLYVDGWLATQGSGNNQGAA